MTTSIFDVSTPQADAWVAFDKLDGADYYYGGTRMVSPETREPDVIDILHRLMSEESAFKNHLINICLMEGVLSGYAQRAPPGFMDSKVGGARCVIRPRDRGVSRILQDPSHPQFDQTISDIFLHLGELLNKHCGLVKLTPDFGRYAGLADILERHTPHVLGIRCEAGGCGGKSSYAATGILTALDMLGAKGAREAPVTVIGSAGALGVDVTRYFTADDFADVAVCDLAYDGGEAPPPDNAVMLPSVINMFTNQCLMRGGLIVATTFGGELANSEWEAIPPETLLVLAHNLSVPPGEAGVSLMRRIASRGVRAIPGQLLTFGGALTSRLEWFWRQSRQGEPFDKELAHMVVRDVMKHLLTEVQEVERSTGVTTYEAMLAYAASKER